MKKMLITSLAALGVAGMIGGGTFATWHDYTDVVGNASGAGVLKLNAGDPTAIAFDNVHLRPGQSGDGQHQDGEYYEREIFLASSDAASVPDGKLTMWFENYLDTEEDGDVASPFSGTCTTQSESDEESGNCGTDGEFGEEGDFIVKWSDPVPDATDCDTAGYPNTLGNFASVNSILGTHVDSTTPVVLANSLEEGQGVCLNLTVILRTNATDAVQGDKATWDTHFQLDQVIPNP